MSDVYIFQVIASFWTDKFYYKLYNSAKSNSQDSSVTETYRTNLKEFCSSMKSIDDCYRRVIYDLHHYCKRSPSLSNLTYTEFIDRIVHEVVPEEYIGTLSQSDKDGFLCKMLTEVAIKFANFIIRVDILRKVIDQRDDAHSKALNTTMLYEEVLNILRTQKDIFLHSFICEINESQETVSIDILTSARMEIRKIQSKYDDLKNSSETIKYDFDNLLKEHKRISNAYEELKENAGSLSVKLEEKDVEFVKQRRFIELLVNRVVSKNNETVTLNKKSLSELQSTIPASKRSVYSLPPPSHIPDSIRPPASYMTQTAERKLKTDSVHFNNDSDKDSDTKITAFPSPEPNVLVDNIEDQDNTSLIDFA